MIGVGIGFRRGAAKLTITRHRPLSIPTPLRAATGRHHYPLSGWLEAWAYVVVLTLLNLISVSYTHLTLPTKRIV